MRICIGALPLWIVISVTLSAKVPSGCNTPVFRYALEHCQPDHDEVVVLHHPLFSAAQNQPLETLQRAIDNEDSPAKVTAQALLGTPARRIVVNRIAAGASLVGILIESGDSSKNDAIEQFLRQRLAHLEKTLELSGPVAHNLLFYMALRKAYVPVEMCLFKRGGQRGGLQHNSWSSPGCEFTVCCRAPDVLRDRTNADG